MNLLLPELALFVWTCLAIAFWLVVIFFVVRWLRKKKKESAQKP